MNESVIVVTGAAVISRRVLDEIDDDAIVIAADGALDHALAAGLEPETLVGDLDSISADGLEWAEAHATVHRHPPDKDHTDTELALAIAVELDPARLTLVSGGGDRLDHVIAAVGALGHPSLTSIPTIDGWWGEQRLVVVHGPGRAHLEPTPRATVSLLALHGPCSGVTLTGVRWPLADAELAPAVGLGVSNEADGDVDVSVSSGIVTVIVTDADTTHTEAS